MKGKICYILLLLFVLTDAGYSFIQHYNQPFDGDMSGGIVPAEDVKPVLVSPLGIKAIKEEVSYPNPNRFFSHWIFYKYFNSTPHFLQRFADPVDSAYASCAIAKTIIQLLLILLLSIVISGKMNFLKKEVLFAAFLVTPLFQANGYRSFMGIIDTSTTYTFFYALPVVFIIIYFIPLFLKNYYGIDFIKSWIVKVLWIPLALISSLSGPLNPGIALIITFLFFFYGIINFLRSEGKVNVAGLSRAAIKIPADYYFYLIPVTLFSLYSLYLGKYNVISQNSARPLVELYSRLPGGLFHLFTQKPAYPILFLFLGFNLVFIQRFIKTVDGQKIMTAAKWIGLFALIYILLLPLGGYRSYRPDIIRYDTFIPVTLGLIFLLGKTTQDIFYYMSRQQQNWYVPIIIAVVFVYTWADEPGFHKNDCERRAILQIKNAKGNVVKIDDSCKVLSWEIIESPEKSINNARLLNIWNITDEVRLYYQVGD